MKWYADTGGYTFVDHSSGTAQHMSHEQAAEFAKTVIGIPMVTDLHRYPGGVFADSTSGLKIHVCYTDEVDDLIGKLREVADA